MRECRRLRPGLDVELPGSLCYTAGLAPAVRAGALDEAVIDRSVRLVLSAKFRLGLFENPYGDVDGLRRYRDEASMAAAKAVARRIATRSTVLLANPAGVLPLRA